MRLTILDPCHERWEAMRGDARARHCAVCDRRVHDLSARTEAEAMGMLAVFGSEGLCARFEVDEAGAVRHAPPGPGRAMLAAGIMAATMVTGCEAPAAPVSAPPQAQVLAAVPSAVPSPAPATIATAPAACPAGMVRDDAGVCDAPQKRVGVVATQGEVVIVPTARFAYASSKVDPASGALLDAVALALNEHPDLSRIAVVGHVSSDEKGGARLGEARAAAVIAALAARKVGRERLVAEGHGSEDPLADNATKEGREKNRRVQFRVLGQASCPAAGP